MADQEKIEKITIIGVGTYSISGGYTFEKFYKTGENAHIEWIAINFTSTGEKALEVQSSHCVIFFDQEL